MQNVRRPSRQEPRDEDYYRGLIAAVERTDLDGKRAPDRPASIAPIRSARVKSRDATWTMTVNDPRGTHTNALVLFRLSGISYPDLIDNLNPVRDTMSEVLTGLHGHNICVVFILSGSETGISFWLGTLGRNTDARKAAQIALLSSHSLESMLSGFFPNIEMVRSGDSDQRARSLSELFSSSRFYGCLTGIPSPRVQAKVRNPEQLERVIRGLYRQKYAFVIVGEPVRDSLIATSFNSLLEEIRSQSGYVKTSTQRQQTTAVSISAEEVNRYAQHYVSLLELGAKRLEDGRSTGMWRTGAYFMSPDASAYNKLKALLKSTFAGTKSRPQPLRPSTFKDTAAAKQHIDCLQQIENELSNPDISSYTKFNRFQYLTVLNSREIATYVRPLVKEFPGFSVAAMPEFGVSADIKDGPGMICLGEILDGRTATGNRFTIRKNDLSRHVLVTGVTGSGKTNTCMCLLYQLWSRFGIPFMVIEPAKSEYRELLKIEELAPVLQVFTLGDERTSPYRLNPFEIMPGVLVQTHIDLLKSVFNASFIMYSPMPYVLEQCLHEVYEDKGWDLLTGTNRYDTRELKDKAILFPTLTDLYLKVDDVVERLGYERRISMDVRAGLKTRLNSLRIGGKGTMLDCFTSTPIEQLLVKPTVLELKRIGDDEEKAFLIGLILIKLYEHLEARSQRKSFSHLTLIEEAHRLLANVPTDTGNLESANTRGKSLETFCNILSEIRAYGEGVMVAEQIPVKLAPDVIKNTNLKVLHRMVALDDREAVGYTMNLDEPQMRYVTTLDRGIAAAFAEGMDKPALVAVPLFEAKRSDTVAALSDAEVGRRMHGFFSDHPGILGQYYGCRHCKARCSCLHFARRLTDQLRYRRRFYALLTQTLISPGIFGTLYSSFVRTVESAMRERDMERDRFKGHALCAGIQLAQYYFQMRRDQYGYSYASMEASIRGFNDLFARANNLYLEKKLKDMDALLLQPAQSFRNSYSEILKRPQGPFLGCETCKSKCFFRYEMAPLVYSESWDSRFRAAAESDDKESSIRTLCLEASENVAPDLEQRYLIDLARCYLVQQAAAVGIENRAAFIKKVFPKDKTG